MLEWLYSVDYAVLDAIQGIHTDFLDAAMRTVTHLGDGGVFWLAMGVILCFPQKTRKWGFGLILAVIFGAIGCNVILKNAVQRIRPYDNPLGTFTAEQLMAQGIDLPHDWSFPSGHTTASFAAATAIFLRSKKVGTPLLILAAVIAFSRLYLYIHYPSDVLVGMLWGITAAILAYLVLNKLTNSQKFGARLQTFWNARLQKKS
ncbi:MAG: phosphatase PAP2 family protein [Clostridia bacterium]|nr:phosphatase PAP2 family protein [Clostridia bacterium]